VFFDLAGRRVPDLDAHGAARGGATAIRGELDAGDDLLIEKRQPLTLLVVPYLEDVEGRRAPAAFASSGLGAFRDGLQETDAANVPLAEEYPAFRTKRTQLRSRRRVEPFWLARFGGSFRQQRRERFGLGKGQQRYIDLAPLGSELPQSRLYLRCFTRRALYRERPDFVLADELRHQTLGRRTPGQQFVTVPALDHFANHVVDGQPRAVLVQRQRFDRRTEGITRRRPGHFPPTDCPLLRIGIFGERRAAHHELATVAAPPVIRRVRQ